MKKCLIILLAIVAMVMAMLWLRHNRHAEVDPNLTEAATFQTVTNVTESRPRLALRSVDGVFNSNAPPPLLGQAPNVGTTVEDDLNSEWKTPIDFYGKVVDEGNPVEAATVDLSWNNLTGTQTRKTESDALGFFSLRSEQGKYLSVKVGKNDYYTSKLDQSGFFYAGENENFIPDQANPVLFHLRKRGKAEPLIVTEYPGFAKIAQLKRDGNPMEIDLSKGVEALAGATIKLQFWADPIEKNTKVFNWKCGLSLLGGGLVEATDEFNFEAPEDGYQPSLEIDMPISAEGWRADTRRKYFFKLSDGKYGRIELFLLPRNGVFTIHSFINPSGARNLEFDEKVQPKATRFE